MVQQNFHNINNDPNLHDLLNYTTVDLIMTKQHDKYGIGFPIVLTTYATNAKQPNLGQNSKSMTSNNTSQKHHTHYSTNSRQSMHYIHHNCNP